MQHNTLSVPPRRSSSQLQGRTSLPALPSATPPPPLGGGGHSQQIVPYTMLRGKNSPVGIRNTAAMLESDEKMRLLETRLGVTEKSNRALLEEVLRLQNELRVTVARNEQSIRDEKQARMQLDSSMHMVNDLISQLASRIKSTEEKLTEEKSALGSLLSHTKGVEQAVLASQQELQTKKDVHGNKLMELQTKLMDSQRSKDQLEKTVYSLTDELRAVRNKLDGQQGEFSTVVTDLKLRSRRLEEENKLQLDALRKQGDIQSHTEQHTSHLRGQVETRLSELRDVIMDLRARQDAEVNERRTLEQMLQQKVNELNMALGEQHRKREESMHALDMIHREKEHSSETDKLKLQSRLTENLDEMNKRLLTKEIKLREEMQQKQQQLEKVYQTEVEKRAEHERKMREENELRWAALKQVSQEEMHGLKDALKNERARSKESVTKLDESISLLEKQLQEQKRLSDKIIAAEIKSRKDHERRTHETIESVQEKLQVATATLQQSIGGVNGHMATHTDKMRQDMRAMIEASEQSGTRAMTDLDVRVQSMKQRVSTLEQSLDSRISEATAMLAQNIREKVESISLWQDVTSQTIRELNQAIQQIPNDVYVIEEKQKLLKSEMESRVTSEAESRIQDVENLKQEVAVIAQRKQPQPATQQDLQEVQASVRRLAESVQTVKTVLGMKIQSEQKLRTDDTKRLDEELEDLRQKIKPLMGDPHFVKGVDNGDGGGGDSSANAGVNRWSVYTTYRWLTWKSRIMYLKWRKSSRKPRPASQSQSGDGSPHPAPHPPPPSSAPEGSDIGNADTKAADSTADDAGESCGERLSDEVNREMWRGGRIPAGPLVGWLGPGTERGSLALWASHDIPPRVWSWFGAVAICT
ncbi:hypothetical protein ACOMHN_024479 [Nucella lapillus]